MAIESTAPATCTNIHAEDEELLESPDLQLAITRENFDVPDNSFYEAVTVLDSAPGVGSEFHMAVADSSRYAVGMHVYIALVGVFEVTALYSDNYIMLKNETATPGALIAVGLPVVACAPQATAATSSDSASLYDTLAQTFNAPSAGGTADLYVVNGGWFTTNLWVFVQGLGWYKISSLDAGDNTHCVVTHINTDTSLATLGSTSGSASAGQPVIVQPPPQFRPDASTIEATNSGGTPGNSTLRVKDNFLNNRLFVQGVTSPRMEFGGASVTAPGVNDDQLLVTVTFAEEFSSAPVVHGLTIESDADLGSNLLDLALYVRDVSSTGFKIYGTVATGAVAADFVVNWAAIGA